ncbi:MAG TPA: hypothetical protein VLF59_01400 [Candidatus Saccharimonadales bacterium]|nr:hypothetical protein [Candidatus Saccharimonadales bacterium]
MGSAKARINRSDVYVSPVVFVELFDDTRKEVGDKELFGSRKYKVLREAWIASLFSVTLSIGLGGVWWLRPNPEDVAPDFFAFNTKEVEGEDYKEGINARWEIFEWGEHSTYKLVDAVKRKAGRLHDNKMSVIGYAAKSNETLDFQAIHAALMEQKPDVLEVWLLAKIKEFNNAHVLTQVYPYLYAVPVPATIPAYFNEPYAFVSKYRGKVNRDGGVLSINDQMEIKVIEKDPFDSPYLAT